MNWSVDFSHDSGTVRDRIIALLEEHSILEGGKINDALEKSEVKEFPIFENLGLEGLMLSQELDSTQEQGPIPGDLTQSEEAFMISATQQADIQRMIRGPETSQVDTPWDDTQGRCRDIPQDSNLENSVLQEPSVKTSLDGNVGTCSDAPQNNKQGTHTDTAPDNSLGTHTDTPQEKKQGTLTDPLQDDNLGTLMNTSAATEDQVSGDQSDKDRHVLLDDEWREDPSHEDSALSNLESFIVPLEPEIIEDHEIILRSCDEPPAKKLKTNDGDPEKSLVETINSVSSSFSDEFIISATQVAELALKGPSHVGQYIDLDGRNELDEVVVASESANLASCPDNKEKVVVDLVKENDVEENREVCLNDPHVGDTTSSPSAEDKAVIDIRQDDNDDVSHAETSPREEGIASAHVPPTTQDKGETATNNSNENGQPVVDLQSVKPGSQEGDEVRDGVYAQPLYSGYDDQVMEQSHRHTDGSISLLDEDKEDGTKTAEVDSQPKENGKTEEPVSTQDPSQPQPLCSEQHVDVEPINLTADDNVHEMSDITHVPDSTEQPVAEQVESDAMEENQSPLAPLETGSQKPTSDKASTSEDVSIEEPSAVSSLTIPPYQVPCPQPSTQDNTVVPEDNSDEEAPVNTSPLAEQLLPKIIAYWKQRHLENPIRSNILFQFASSYRPEEPSS